MTMTYNPASRATKTTAQALAEQKAQAERDRQQNRAAQQPVARPRAVFTAVDTATPTAPSRAGTEVTPPDTRTPGEKYLDEISPVATLLGRPAKFDGKAGKFIFDDTGEEIPPNRDFLALCADILVGHIRFHDEGTPPDVVMGLRYEGFVPDRNAFGDLNPADWPISEMSGQPEDPWRHQMCLPLLMPETMEMATFRTMSKTGSNAVGVLLRHYERLIKKHPDHCPIVRLKLGGYEDKRGRGWIHVPVFAVVGHSAVDSTSQPDSSLAGDMDDGIPDFTK